MIGFIVTLIAVAGPVFLLAAIVALVMWPRKPRARKMRGQVIKLWATNLSEFDPQSDGFSRRGTIYCCTVRVGDAHGTTLVEPWIFDRLSLSNAVQVHVTGSYDDNLSVSGISRI